MQRLRHAFVWLMRIGHCRGFGVQSPTDYWLVRYVINEHWPYYQYTTLGEGDEWLTRKLGLLYFRIANWLQPHVIESDGFRQYLQAGCQKAEFGDSKELIRLTLEGDYRSRLANIYNKVDTAFIHSPKFLLEEDKFYGGYMPRRTYKGMKFQKKGFSDHLPVYIDLGR